MQSQEPEAWIMIITALLQDIDRHRLYLISQMHTTTTTTAANFSPIRLSLVVTTATTTKTIKDIIKVKT